MRIIISASEAHEIIKKSENVVIFDCRGDLNDKELGLKQYQAAHLPNAHFIDGEKDLSSGVQQHGGRHPLPDLEEFVLMLEKFGVSNNSSVITYGLYAPRLVFMLNLIGLSTVYFIDGGFDSWQKAGLTISTDLPQNKTGGLTNNFQSQLLVEMAEVLDKIDKPDVKLIDSRAPERYRGEVEPLDRIPGHIPSADNYFWQANFGTDGLLKPLQDILKQLEPLNLKPDDEKILYCGSGITAAYNYIVFSDLNIPTRVYAGSYSDWVSYHDNPVKTLEK